MNHIDVPYNEEMGCLQIAKLPITHQGKILVLLSFVSHTHRIYFDYYASHNILSTVQKVCFSFKFGLNANNYYKYSHFYELCSHVVTMHDLSNIRAR